MPLIDKATLVARLAPPLDQPLTESLVDEFISLERRFIQRDWEPAELDGGQFCEVLSRILYHMDANNLNRGRRFEDCLSYIEDDRANHAITPRHDAIHIAKVLK